MSSSMPTSFGNITISNGGTSYSYGAGSTITVGTGAGTGFFAQTIADLDPVTFKWKNEEFVDCLPDFNRITEMCKTYPGLAIAFEKFKTTYYLVKDDYDTPKDKK